MLNQYHLMLQVVLLKARKTTDSTQWSSSVKSALRTKFQMICMAELVWSVFANRDTRILMIQASNQLMKDTA
jgi:hypothetical protein